MASSFGRSFSSAALACAHGPVTGHVRMMQLPATEGVGCQKPFVHWKSSPTEMLHRPLYKQT